MTETLSRAEVSQRVCACVRESMELYDEVSLAATLVEDLGAMPPDFVEIKGRLSTEFNIKISPQELFVQPPGAAVMEFNVSINMTVGDAVDYICERLGINDE